MTSWVKPNTKCVCIDDNWGCEGFMPKRNPIRGEELTVHSAEVSNGRLYINFCEIPQTIRVLFFRADVRWLADCFRPVVSQTDDVALFAHLLTPTRIEEDA
ncbi:MAG: hypothetical protein WD472_11325 [Dehalococcoidia bacterium]